MDGDDTADLADTRMTRAATATTVRGRIRASKELALLGMDERCIPQLPIGDKRGSQCDLRKHENVVGERPPYRARRDLSEEELI